MMWYFQLKKEKKSLQLLKAYDTMGCILRKTIVLRLIALLALFTLWGELSAASSSITAGAFASFPVSVRGAGMGGANAMAGAVDSSYGTQYDLSRFSARDFHTPPNTNPYYRLFVRTGINTRSVHIGENGNGGTIYEVGGTIVTIMEVAA